MFKRVLLSVFVISGFAYGRELPVYKPLDLLSFMEIPAPVPEGYTNLLPDIEHFSTEIDWYPADTLLSCRQQLVFRAVSNPESPLTLAFDYSRLDAAVDSLYSAAGVDSFVTFDDSLLVFFSAGLQQANLDTLTIVFTLGRDYLSGRDPYNHPQQSRYYGFDGWCPFPVYFEGRHTVETTLSAPDSLRLAAMGAEQTVAEAGDGRSRHSWRTAGPVVHRPVFVIDNFKAARAQAEGGEIRILHKGLDDATVTELLQWATAAIDTFTTWYGELPQRSITLVYPSYNDFIPSEKDSPGVVYLGNRILNAEGVLYYEEFGKSTFFRQLAYQWWGVHVPVIEHYRMPAMFIRYSSVLAVYGENPERWSLLLRNFKWDVLGSVGQEYDKPLTDQSSGMFQFKGLLVLKLLEETIGREAFRAALKDFQQRYAMQSATLDDFFAVVEEHHGSDLSRFKNDWFTQRGVPVVRYRGEMREDQPGAPFKLFITLEGAPYELLLSAAFYFDNGMETDSITLTSLADTLFYPFAAEPDSFTLRTPGAAPVKFIHNLTADIAPFGDRPANPDGFELEFYLDSLQSYSAITLSHSVGGDEWAVEAIDPDSLESGFGRLHLPEIQAGSEVIFFLRVVREDGAEYTLPEGAPDDTLFSFRVTSLPEPERQGYAAFNQRFSKNGLLLSDQDPFRSHYHGISGFDLETLEPFGVLYNVGNYAPRIDMGKQRLIALNRESNSVDVVNLGGWRLEAKIPLPDTLLNANRDYAHSVLDPDRLIYYLNDGVRLFKVELEGGGKATLMRTGSGWIPLPISMEFNVRRDILLLGNGSLVQLLSGGTNEVLQSFRTRRIAVPHLLNDGRVFTLEIKSESVGMREYSGRNWLIGSWYDPAGRDYARVDSAVSPVFEIPGQRMGQFFISGMGIVFQDRAGLVIVNQRTGLNSEPDSKILIWNYSANADTLVYYDINKRPQDIPIIGIYTDQSGSRVIAGSQMNPSFSLLELDPPALNSTHYSPFTGEFSEERIFDPRYITGLALPPSGRSPDIDGSGATDLADVMELLKVIKPGGTAVYEQRFDINADGKVNIFDLLELLRRVGRK